MKEDFSELVEYLDKKFQKTATKEDINNLAVELVAREEFDLFTKETVKELKNIKDNINNLQTSVDKYAEKADAYFQEMIMMAHKIDRHEKWFQIVADKLGIKLPY